MKDAQFMQLNQIKIDLLQVRNKRNIDYNSGTRRCPPRAMRVVNRKVRNNLNIMNILKDLAQAEPRLYLRIPWLWSR